MKPALNTAVVGGGAAGLFASLLLARAGHEVVVFEQDRLEPAADVESAAASAYRPTAPQIVQPHMIMARCRELLLERLPDVYDALLAAGVADAPLWSQMPASLSDHARRSGDDRFSMLVSRRSTFDWVLRRAATAEPKVTLRRGVRVAGLLAESADPPRVVGLHTDQGEFPADLVVDASGRRSRIDHWLDAIGAAPPATSQAECGLAYFSRHYRRRPGAELPGLPTTRIVAGFDEFTVGIWGGDNEAMQLAVVPLAADRRFRVLKHPDTFTAVLRSVPTYAAWLDVLDPISPVHQMAGLHNTLRRLVVDGAPVVSGLHAIGDSLCTTNPTLGRGLTLALSSAVDLLDAISKHEDDCIAQALMLDDLIADHVVPFYQDQATIDQARLTVLRHNVCGDPLPEPAAVDWERVSYAELRSAAQFDPTAFRAFWKVQGMLSRPDEIYTDPEVVACTRQTLRSQHTVALIEQPTRTRLLVALMP
jgi:2-polyprenyl-6-methoxyphenol hydroxylase-like FAD-dependent oxidoreductase